MLIALGLACARSDPPAPKPASETTSSAANAPIPLGAPLRHAECVAHAEDPTRATCTLQLTGTGPATVDWTDGVERVRFSTQGVANRHEIQIWGLHAEAPWTWTARAGGEALSGQIQPTALGRALGMAVDRTGRGPSRLVQFLAPADCNHAGFVVVLDAAGRVRWFFDTQRKDVDMAQFTEASTVLALADQSAILEVDLLGNVLLERDDFPTPLHHDVFRRGDRIYTLQVDVWTESNGLDYAEDIVLGLDLAGEEVWRWEEHDHLDATLASLDGVDFWNDEFPGAYDPWHTNSVFPTDDGDFLVSIKHESTILRVSGNDGAIEWVLAGDGVGRVFPSDFTAMDVGIEPVFGNEHHLALLPDGHLTLFDNDRDRGVEIALDETEMTATFVAEWPMGLRCAIQGAVFPLAGEHRLLTCATPHEIAEFDETGAEVARWVLSCPDGGELPRTERAQPVDLWNGLVVGGVTAQRLP